MFDRDIPKSVNAFQAGMDVLSKDSRRGEVIIFSRPSRVSNDVGCSIEIAAEELVEGEDVEEAGSRKIFQNPGSSRA